MFADTPLTHDSWRAESEEEKNDFGFKTSPNNKIRPNLIMFCFQRVTLPLDLQNLLIVASIESIYSGALTRVEAQLKRTALLLLKYQA